MKVDRKMVILLIIILLAGGGSHEASSDPPVVPPQPPPPPKKPPKALGACLPDGVNGKPAYNYFGYDTADNTAPLLGVRPNVNAAMFGMTGWAFNKAMTILTRVINDAYTPAFDGAEGLCTRANVQAKAKVKLNHTEALAMLGYWEVRNADKPSPHPQVDPALAGITMADQRQDWQDEYDSLLKFFKHASSPP